jgi:hypothetical protein
LNAKQIIAPTRKTAARTTQIAFQSRNNKRHGNAQDSPNFL